MSYNPNQQPDYGKLYGEQPERIDVGGLREGSAEATQPEVPSRPPSEEDEVVAAYASGKPVDAIAAWFGLSRDHVQRIVSQHAYAAEGSRPPADVPVPSRRGNRWPMTVGTALVGLLVVGLLAAIAVQRYRASEPEKPAEQVSPFQQVQSDCDSVGAGTTVTDNGQTLLIDLSGEEDFGKLSVSGLQCVLDGLRVPAAVRAHMFETRALDGRQESQWPGFTASWSYHPDQGMDVIVRTEP